jgi:hypothetical protein
MLPMKTLEVASNPDEVRHACAALAIVDQKAYRLVLAKVIKKNDGRIGILMFSHAPNNRRQCKLEWILRKAIDYIVQQKGRHSGSALMHTPICNIKYVLFFQALFPATTAGNLAG